MQACACRKDGDASPSPFEAAQDANQPKAVVAQRHRQQLLDVVRRAPEQLGQTGSRWTLTALQQVCDWATASSPASLSRLLRRLGIHYKRARSYIHSPDAQYDEKQAAIVAIKRHVRSHPDQAVLLYIDEYSAMRQPKVGRAYAAVGHDQALAERSTESDRALRVLAALNLVSGQVTYRLATKTDSACFVAFWQQLVACYPGMQIFLVIDNWSMHFHPKVLAPLQLQSSPFAFPVSRSWQGLVADGRQPQVGTLPIQYLPLPTYASWLNPIEKLWLRLGEKELVLHRHANDLDALRRALEQFLDSFAQGSVSLLRAVGLSPPEPTLI